MSTHAVTAAEYFVSFDNLETHGVYYAADAREARNMAATALAAGGYYDTVDPEDCGPLQVVPVSTLTGDERDAVFSDFGV